MQCSYSFVTFRSKLIFALFLFYGGICFSASFDLYKLSTLKMLLSKSGEFVLVVLILVKYLVVRPLLISLQELRLFYAVCELLRSSAEWTQK